MGIDLSYIYEELRRRCPEQFFVDCYMDCIMQKEGLTPDQKLRIKLFDILDKRIFEDEVSSMDLAAALLALLMGEGAAREDDLSDKKVPCALDDLEGRRGERRDHGERVSGRGRFDGKKLKVRKRGGKEHPDDDMVRLFINIGKKQHVKPGDILGAIAGEAGISGRLVGAIDLGESFSFVDVDRKNADKVMRAMKNVKIRGLNVHMEKANGEK